jgi:hypothetical protein
LITQDKIDETVTWDGLKDFGRFVLSHCEDGGLPDYKKMELIGVPQLVPHIWVYDLRHYVEGDGLLVNFVGEKFTELYGHNHMGDIDIDIYKEHPLFDSVGELYRKSIAQKNCAYTSRYGQHDFGLRNDNKYRYAKTLFFPCSTDGETVDWGIGCAIYAGTPASEKNRFILLTNDTTEEEEKWVQTA